MRRRRSPFIIISLILLLGACAAIAYVRIVDCTLCAGTSFADEIAHATGKSVFIRSVRLTLLKGLIVDKIIIYDKDTVIVSSDEVSCGLVLPSIVSRRILVPVVTIESPLIRMQRRPDGSLSILDLIPKQYSPKSGLALSIHKIVIKNGRVDFTDGIIAPAFTCQIRGLNAQIKLYLPVRTLFDISFYIPSAVGTVSSSGEYIIPTNDLVCDVSVERLGPKEFLPYYSASGLSFPSGTVDARGALQWQSGAFRASIEARTRDLIMARDAARMKFDASTRAMVSYTADGKKPTVSGTMDIRSMDIYGLQHVGRLENIKANASFTGSRIRSENAQVTVFGIPWNVTLNIVNFNAPILDIYADSAPRLSALQQALKDHFNVNLPVEISGKGRLKVALQIEPETAPKLNGYLTFDGATINPGGGHLPLEAIYGEARFNSSQARWAKIRCRYDDKNYTTSGAINDFASPRTRLDVDSENLSYKVDLVLRNKTILLSKLNGRLFDSGFTVSGQVDFDNPASLAADIRGEAVLSLGDLKKISRDPAVFNALKPEGVVNSRFEFSGDIKNFMTCHLDAGIRSKALTIGGYKLTDLSFEYVQNRGKADIKSLRSAFYGGTLSASAQVDWLGKEAPYSAKIDMIGVGLNRLKETSGFKDRDVSGTLKIYADLKGALKDATRLVGIGHASIKDGRLWQLDLFKGAGALIFSSDFGEVLFTEGACDFKIKDRAAYIENLVMKSDQVDLYGSGRIGMDRSINAVLRPEINEEAVSDGTAGKVAVAIGKGTVIEVDGSLKEPRFKTRTSVVDVVGAILQDQ